MKELKINHPAVWVCIVLAQLIPFAWYSIFARQWMSLNQLDETFLAANQNMGPYIVSVLVSIVTMYTLAWIYSRMGVASAQAGLLTGLIIGIAFNVFSLVTIHMFSFRPVELAVIDGGANALTFGIAGLVLGAWRKKD